MRPWLWIPPRWAHDLSSWVLPALAHFSQSSKSTPIVKPFAWRNLNFQNRLGIAGGVDKTGDCLLAWQKFGCGFLEVGTITPHPQSANPGKIMDRDVPTEVVWNKMGFPNNGAVALKKKLQKIKSHINVPLFINIGKNRTTPNEQASQDYLSCLKTLEPHADAFVINISSPNTKDLRELLSRPRLQDFLTPLIKEQSKPLLLKLSPDTDEKSLIEAIDTSYELGIAGWVLTNTTTQRTENNLFPQEGGLSGKPLNIISKEKLKQTLNHLSQRKKNQLVISVGGISNKNDVEERLALGADLLQIYSALVFQGPFLFKKLLSEK